MAGVISQIPVVIAGTGTRSPAIEALLQGPEEYAAAMAGDVSEEEMAQLKAAAAMFEAGVHMADLEPSNVGPRELAESMISMKLATYAVGRATVIDAMHSRRVDGKRTWVFDPNFHPKPKPTPEIREPQLDNNIDHQRTDIGSPREMARWPTMWEMPLHASAASHSKLMLNTSLTNFGIRSDEAVSDQLSQLEAVWSDPQTHAQLRLDALKTWYQIAVGGAVPQPDSFGVQFVTTDALLNVAKKLLDVIQSLDALHDPKDEERTLQRTAVLVLGELIRTSYERSALLLEFFSRSFILALDEPSTSVGAYGHTLIRAAGAVFAASHINGHSSRHDETLSGSALRFLDVAGNGRAYPLDLRTRAFRYGLYAIPRFGPPSIGPRILHDFALWQVQARDPETAASMAHAYGALYTAMDSRFAGIIPPNAVQRAMLLEALKRRDLAPGQRDDLWGQITRNSDLLVATEVALRRRFGESADPRP